MELINSGLMHGTRNIQYIILENGFDIYIEGDPFPTYHQYEPYIPDHTKTYEENAIEMCKQLVAPEISESPQKTVEERLTDAEANIDYLMLLNDPDSTSDGE